MNINYIYRRAVGYAQNRNITWLVISTLLIFDGLLSYAILCKIPYTEIDWEAYMQQISQYRAGERDYRKIKGGTGPLVYPAGHVHIFNILYLLTDGGEDRGTTQAIFWFVYMLTLFIVSLCYKAAKAPPWIFPLLVLSKRLHSIYLLRFFNDCFSTLFMFLSIYLVQKKQYTASALLYSLSVSVKMSSLLYLPAFGLVLVMSTGSTWKTARLASLMAQLQIILALPFIASESGSVNGYLGRAFEFSRAFLWKWTVNWRFVGEDIFQSTIFKHSLLCVHAFLLFLFLYTRWLWPSRLEIHQFVAKLLYGGFPESERAHISRRATANYILTTLCTCNLIGLLCARSLHYQFYSWMAWTTPFILWKSNGGPLFVITVWAVQEYAWNVFPSTRISSALVVISMVAQLLGVWLGTWSEGKELSARSTGTVEGTDKKLS